MEPLWKVQLGGDRVRRIMWGLTIFVQSPWYTFWFFETMCLQDFQKDKNE